jgi:hypothetical protein
MNESGGIAQVKLIIRQEWGIRTGHPTVPEGNLIEIYTPLATEAGNAG